MKRFYILLAMALFATSANAQLYKSKAEASYYAEKFHGKKTANGETFNMNDMTCANKELPFNTILKVTNLSNGRTVRVRVNDRGPFVKGRDIDLSKAAAIKLDMIKTGTAYVRLEVEKMGENTKQSYQSAKIASEKMGSKPVTDLKSSSKSESAVKVSADMPSELPAANKTTSSTIVLKADTIYNIQMGSFGNIENAKKLALKLKKEGFNKVTLEKSGSVTRVLIADLKPKQVKEVSKSLRERGYSDFQVKERH